jgi:KipI family sensor histidine kinase inhibitor
VQSAGDDLISVAVADPEAAQTLAATLRGTGDWIEAVAGIDTVVVRFDIAVVSHRDAEDKLIDAIANVEPRAETTSASITIPIVYGGKFGPDFEFVCETLALTREEFIELHSGEYRVDMLGFIPGFAYIGGLNARLNIDRLSAPRQLLPAGSVGIAGGRTGLYALPGPGGWPIIGRTSCVLFDPESSEPFTLSAGATVVFRPVDAL